MLCFQNFGADVFETVFLASCSFPEGWHSTASMQSPMIPVFSYVNDINASSSSMLLVRALAKHMLLVIFVHGGTHADLLDTGGAKGFLEIQFLFLNFL